MRDLAKPRQLSKSKAEEIMRRQGGSIHLTGEGLGRLKQQLARLKEEMPGLIDETQRTAAYGDRSDNAEYKEAKSTLRRVQGRILKIESQIRRAVIIEPERNISGTVQLGSTVVLEINGMQKTYQILGPHETDPSAGRISYRSPLGAALINHKKDDIVIFNSPAGGGPKEYRIIKISN